MPFLVKIKKLLKKMLQRKIFRAVHEFARHYIRPLIDRDAKVELQYLKQFTAQYGFEVIAGPFKGMQYTSRAIGSVLLLKLVGCYEKVLHPTLEKIVAEQKIKTVIDIGCAEGYYLVGLGTRLPQAKLIGYDTEPDCLELAREMMEKNNIGNETKLETTCTPASLAEDITENTLLICDAEGFEKTILDPEKVPKLKEVDTLIVETHDEIVENVTTTLIERFSPTHNITSLQYDNSTYKDQAFLSEIKNTEDLKILTTERGIPDQTVLVMKRKTFLSP